MNPMNPFLTAIAVKIAEKLIPIVAEKLMALLPLIAAAVAKAVADQVLSRIPDIDLDLPGLPELADTVRNDLNRLPDVDIPVLSDIFDLTEWLKNR